MTLKDKALEVSEELTRMGIAPAQNHHVYAPHLVKLGQELNAACGNGVEESLRPDVLAFARKMSAVMDAKEQEKQTSNQREPTASKSLSEIQFQLGKFQRIPLPDYEEIQRIFVHVANIAMIGMDALLKDKKYR